MSEVHFDTFWRRKSLILKEGSTLLAPIYYSSHTCDIQSLGKCSKFLLCDGWIRSENPDQGLCEQKSLFDSSSSDHRILISYLLVPIKHPFAHIRLIIYSRAISPIMLVLRRCESPKNPLKFDFIQLRACLPTGSLHQPTIHV